MVGFRVASFQNQPKQSLSSRKRHQSRLGPHPGKKMRQLCPRNWGTLSNATVAKVVATMIVLEGVAENRTALGVPARRSLLLTIAYLQNGQAKKYHAHESGQRVHGFNLPNHPLV